MPHFMEGDDRVPFDAINRQIDEFLAGQLALVTVAFGSQNAEAAVRNAAGELRISRAAGNESDPNRSHGRPAESHLPGLGTRRPRWWRPSREPVGAESPASGGLGHESRRRHLAPRGWL